MSEIGITIGADWGCEHTASDGDAYAEFVERWFAARGLRVAASYDDKHLGPDDIDTDRYTHDDVRAMLEQCWESWCEKGWHS